MSENEGVIPTKGHASGQAWRREREIASARPPKSAPESKDVEDLARNSNLNAEAAEFVPQWSQAAQPEGMPTFPNLAYQRGVLGVERGPFGDLAPTRCYIGPVPYRYPLVNLSKNLSMPLPIQQYPIPFIPPQTPGSYPFPPNQQLSNGLPAKFQGSTTDDITYLAEVIEVLSLSPGRYDEFIVPIEDIVDSLQNESRALAQVIDLIIQQCIVQPNFRYTGARICRDIAGKFGIVFISALLPRLQERFTTLDEVMNRDRVEGFGFAMLLAELFHQVTIDNGHIIQLGQAITQLMNKFLNYHGYDVVRTIVQIIKLCGIALEKTGFALQPFFDKLEKLACSGTADENTQRIIAGLMHLKRTEWDNLMAESNIPSPSPVVNLSDEPVFYSPDGEVMSEEERSFLLEQMPDAEDRENYVVENQVMDDETFEAYQEFVKYSHTNHKNHNQGG